MRFTFGADPEIFVFDKSTKEPMSAHGLVPGDKANPFPVQNGAIQVDGMALEFNINPASNQKQFTSNVFSVLKQMKSMLPVGTETKVASHVYFSDEVMRTAPEEAKELGCEPDFNAYTKDMNPPPYPDPYMRTAAGHIHIGWGKGNFDVDSEEHLSSCRMIVKAMDLFVGVWSVYRDRDKQRREMYGRAGSFRPKPYGVEYRTLSNFWLKNPTVAAETFRRTKEACNWVMLNGNGIPKIHQGDVKEAINYSDIAYADRLIYKYGIEL